MLKLETDYRVITVPKNSVACKLLDYDKAEADDLIELRLSEAAFYALEKKGLFRLFNSIAHSNIDDYEDDFISEPKLLTRIIAELVVQKDNFTIPEDPDLVDGILELFRQAVQRETRIHFFF